MVPLTLLASFDPSTTAPAHLLSHWGLLAVAVFVAIESSGIPFPGETMLIAAAVYAGTGRLPIVAVILSAAAGAIVGDNLGYLAGRYGGRALVIRYGKYVRIKPHHVRRAEVFFDRYGDRTVFFGRFVAVLRTWAALLAGTNRMDWRRFLVFNAAGGIVWAAVYGLLGFALGNNLPLLHRILRIMGVGGVLAALLIIAVAGVVWWRRRPAPESVESNVTSRRA